MSAWITEIAAQLQITDLLFALCLGLVLILFLFVSVFKTAQLRLPLSLARQRFRQLVDQSTESGRPINVSLAHQGLGTSGLINSTGALQVVADISMGNSNGIVQANLLCADGIVAAAGLMQIPDADPAQATSVRVDYTGPDPFLAAVNSEAMLEPESLQYTFGQANPEPILLTRLASYGSAPLGGAPSALSGLLLSTTPQDAIFGESYYTAQEDSSASVRILRLHNLVRALIIVGFVVGLVSSYLGLR